MRDKLILTMVTVLGTTKFIHCMSKINLASVIYKLISDMLILKHILDPFLH